MFVQVRVLRSVCYAVILPGMPMVVSRGRCLYLVAAAIPPALQPRPRDMFRMSRCILRLPRDRFAQAEGRSSATTTLCSRASDAARSL